MVKQKLSQKAIKKKFKCSPCAVSAAIGVYTNVCKKLRKGECREIINRLAQDKISVDTAFKQIKSLAKNHPKELKALNYVDKLLNE